jgi:signal recognition particle subunit SRP72
LTDSEKEAEIMPMKVQQVYVLTQLGKIDEAEQLSTTIPFAEIRELSTRYIAQVNSIAASTKHTNPYLSHRLFHSSPKPHKTDQPFTFQSHILRQDEYTIDLMAHKVSGVISHTSKLIEAASLPSTSLSVTTAAVFNAAAHAQNLSEKAALKEILPILERRPNDIGLLLTIVQLYVLTKNLPAATQLLESFFNRLEQSGTSNHLDVRHAPGLVGILVSLYINQGRHSHSKSGLAKAASYWRHKSETVPKSLMVAAGSALLETRNPEAIATAGEIFEALYRQDRTDRAAIAGLVAAYSLSDPSSLSPDLVDSLPRAERLVADIDVTALEDAGVPSLPWASMSTANASAKRPAPKETPAKPKRIRKSRMPKDFIEGRTMDPERWLPMRDRTYYRPKGKKGKKKMEGLTQGGAVSEEKVSEQQKQGGGGGGGGAQKKAKKKGKGGKW